MGIWSHLDVVPVPDPAEWMYPPFECQLVENKYLIGRGVQDNKMTAIAVLIVMNCLRELGVPFRHGYSLYMGTSEETGMEDCRYLWRIIRALIYPWCRILVSRSASGSAAA